MPMPMILNRKEHWCRAHVQLFKLIRNFSTWKLLLTNVQWPISAINAVFLTSLATHCKGWNIVSKVQWTCGYNKEVALMQSSRERNSVFMSVVIRTRLTFSLQIGNLPYETWNVFRKFWNMCRSEIQTKTGFSGRSINWSNKIVSTKTSALTTWCIFPRMSGDLSATISSS